MLPSLALSLVTVLFQPLSITFAISSSNLQTVCVQEEMGYPLTPSASCRDQIRTSASTKHLKQSSQAWKVSEDFSSAHRPTHASKYVDISVSEIKGSQAWALYLHGSQIANTIPCVVLTQASSRQPKQFTGVVQESAWPVPVSDEQYGLWTEFLRLFLIA